MFNCFKKLHKTARGYFVFFTFVFTGHFLYMRAGSTRTSGMAKAYSSSLPASLATEDYQVCHCVLALCGVNHQAVGTICTISLFSCLSAHSTWHWKAEELAIVPSWPLVQNWKGDVRCIPSKCKQSPKSVTHCGKLPSLTVPVRKSYWEVTLRGANS